MKSDNEILRDFCQKVLQVDFDSLTETDKNEIRNTLCFAGYSLSVAFDKVLQEAKKSIRKEMPTWLRKFITRL